MADKQEKYEPKTAFDTIETQGEGDLESEVVEKDYEKALKNYEARDDVETLEHRRARESGVAFEDAKFVRDELRPDTKNTDKGKGGVVTSSQTVNK